MGPTLNGPFREVVYFTELEYQYNGMAWAVIWDPNKTIDIGKWSICGVGQLKESQAK